jgi:transposase
VEELSKVQGTESWKKAKTKNRCNVVYYLATGNASEAARKANVNPRAGQRVVKRFKEMGTTANKPRPGRPKLLSDADERAIVRDARKN